MSDNSANTPLPITVDANEERRKFERLPKKLRQALVEAVYEYNVDQVVGVMNEVRKALSYGLFPVSEDTIIRETIKQIDLNDLHLSAKEMEEKWHQELKISQASHEKQSTKPQRWPTKSIGRTATLSATIRNRLGPMRRDGSAIPPSMEFSLYGPATKPPSNPMRTGSARKKPMAGITDR